MRIARSRRPARIAPSGSATTPCKGDDPGEKRRVDASAEVSSAPPRIIDPSPPPPPPCGRTRPRPANVARRASSVGASSASGTTARPPLKIAAHAASDGRCFSRTSSSDAAAAPGHRRRSTRGRGRASGGGGGGARREPEPRDERTRNRSRRRRERSRRRRRRDSSNPRRRRETSPRDRRSRRRSPSRSGRTRRVRVRGPRGERRGKRRGGAEARAERDQRCAGRGRAGPGGRVGVGSRPRVRARRDPPGADHLRHAEAEEADGLRPLGVDGLRPLGVVDGLGPIGVFLGGGRVLVSVSLARVGFGVGVRGQEVPHRGGGDRVRGVRRSKPRRSDRRARFFRRLARRLRLAAAGSSAGAEAGFCISASAADQRFFGGFEEGGGGEGRGGAGERGPGRSKSSRPSSPSAGASEKFGRSRTSGKGFGRSRTSGRRRGSSGSAAGSSFAESRGGRAILLGAAPSSPAAALGPVGGVPSEENEADGTDGKFRSSAAPSNAPYAARSRPSAAHRSSFARLASRAASFASRAAFSRASRSRCARASSDSAGASSRRPAFFFPERVRRVLPFLPARTLAASIRGVTR